MDSPSAWKVFGRDVSRSAATFACQIFILYACILTCLVNLSVGNGSHDLWITLLSLSLGTILPSPKVKTKSLLPSSLSSSPSSSSSGTPPSIIGGV